jgi:hypothetical protein
MRGMPVDPNAPAPLGRSTIVVMAAVLTVTLVVFAYGMISLVLDRDVIAEPDAGPLVGPIMVVTLLAVVLWFVIRRRPDRIGARVLSAGLGAVILGPAVGAVAYAVGRGDFALFLLFFGGYVTSPFVLASGVIASVVVALAWLADAAR